LKEFRVSLPPTQKPVAEHPVNTSIYEMHYANIANHKLTRNDVGLTCVIVCLVSNCRHADSAVVCSCNFMRCATGSRNVVLS